ncbi:MAG: hypothetical protein QW680_12485 [Pyrobaculum sp.]
MENLSKWASNVIRGATTGHDSSDKYTRLIRDVKRLIDYMIKFDSIAKKENDTFYFSNIPFIIKDTMIEAWGWSIDDVFEWLNEIEQTYDEFYNKNRGILGEHKLVIFYHLILIKAFAKELGVPQLYDEVKTTVLKELFDEKKDVEYVKVWVRAVTLYLEEEAWNKKRSTSR